MNFFDRLFSSSLFNISLRVKIMLVFILPMALAVSCISYIHNLRERAELESLAETNTMQLANVMLSSLDHAMLLNDRQMIFETLEKIGEQRSVKSAEIISIDAKVFASTDSSRVGTKLDLKSADCVECHQYPAAERPRAMHLWTDKNLLRVSTPILNAPQCQTCHADTQTHLGVFIIDLSVTEIESHMQEDLLYNALFSAISILCLMLLGYLLIQWLLARRVDVIRAALLRLGARDFSTRITAHWHTRDEITQLADQINNLAQNFEILQTDHEQKDKVRAQAIIDERERIARELHDGVAQFLGYLSAKIGATRVALKNGDEDSANRNLEQIETSIREQSSEVRSAIIGLKMAGTVDRGFSVNVRDFVDQCNRLDDDLVLELEISAEVETLNLEVEKELQLFRILQEAVSNIRKHSIASEASVRLEKKAAQLIMTVADNGVGFDPVKTGVERGGHFGLRIMFERAREIGAQVEIKSSPGAGTRVIVKMDLQESRT